MRTLIEFPAFVPKQLQKQLLAWPGSGRVNVRSLICKCVARRVNTTLLLLEESEAVPQLEDLLLLLLLMQQNEVTLNSEEQRDDARSGKCFFARDRYRLSCQFINIYWHYKTLLPVSCAEDDGAR